MSIETQLASAFRADPTLGQDDLRRRVARRRNRRRALATGGALVLLGLTLLGARELLVDDSDRTIVTGPPIGEPQAVPITDEALAGGLWVAVDTGLSPTTRVATLEFNVARDDSSPLSSWVLDGTCNRRTGEWRIGGGNTLRLATQEPTRGTGCVPVVYERVEERLVHVIAGDATLFDDGTLRFARDGETVTFLDLVSRVDLPTTAQLARSWIAPDGGQEITFRPNGDVTSTSSDGESLSGRCPDLWRYADGLLRILPSGCGSSGSVGRGGALDLLGDEPRRPRLVDDVLYLSGAGTVRLIDEALNVSEESTARPVDADGPGAPMTTDEIVGTRWVLPTAGGGVLPWLEFDDDGTWRGTNDCEDDAHGTWTVDGARVVLERDDSQIVGCADLLTLSGSATMTTDGHLQFDADAERSASVIELERIDDLAVPARTELVDTWWLEDGTIAWGENLLDIGACEFVWNLVGDQLQAISPLCDLSADSPFVAFTGANPGVADVRLDGPVLYLSTTNDVIELIRPGARDSSAVDVVGRWSDSLTLNADGTFDTRGCDSSRGIWTTNGREIHLRRLDRSNLMCLAPIDRITGPGRVRDDEMEFPSELPGDPHGRPVTFHRLD